MLQNLTEFQFSCVSFSVNTLRRVGIEEVGGTKRKMCFCLFMKTGLMTIWYSVNRKCFISDYFRVISITRYCYILGFLASIIGCAGM